jgi:hypothetical protein
MPVGNPFEEQNSSLFYRIFKMVALGAGIVALGSSVAKAGMVAGMGLAALPLVVAYLIWQFTSPQIGLWISLTLSCLSAGLTRYVPMPWGLSIDIFLVLSWIAFLFKRYSYTDWSPLSHDVMKAGAIWMGFVLLEIVNPEARSFAAWFYAMRAIGLHILLIYGLVFLLFRHHTHFVQFINFICWISIFAAVWAMRQKFIGTDAAEDRWLASAENASTHILFGSLRTFSFHSDAGQFGGNMAMMILVGGILALGPAPLGKKILYWVVAVTTLIGFGISGSRGALICPAVGGLVYLVMTKNFKILLAGIFAMLAVYSFLKYTTLLQNVEAVRRMRTALDPDNPSLNSRLRNQKTYRRFLANKPIGAGIGSAGYWGNRFSPGTIPATTPTDSYFVRIWAETGIVGLLLNIGLLGYWMGRAGNILWNTRDPVLWAQGTALLCGYAGMIASSYGNQILSGFPTNFFMYYGMPLVAMIPMYERQKIEEGLFTPDFEEEELFPPDETEND